MIGGRIRLIRCRRRVTLALLAAAFVAFCLYPHIGRLADPSLFSDDVSRIEELQTKNLVQLFSRPFNVHVAPLFDLVTWVTWQLAGRRLSLAPAAFTTSSLIPFGLCLWALGMLVHRESGSLIAALAAVAIFSLSPVHVEVAWWYSASSFAWALLGTLLAWCCTLRLLGVESPAASSHLVGWGIAAVSFAAAAPAFSAIGLLAGPIAALRAVLHSPRPSDRRTIAVRLIPLLGTLVYLMVAMWFHHHRILASTIERKPDVPIGLLCILCAPIDVLLSGLFGLENADRWLGGGPDAILGSLVLLVILAWGLRSPRRPMLLSGLALILGGYAMTLPIRCDRGAHWLLEDQRYHLFPQLGLVLVVVEASRPWLARFDRRPRSALFTATVLAALLMAAHRPLLQRRAWAYRFPDQASTMRALERVESLCRRHRITRTQALAALDPIVRPWYPHAANALIMLGDSVSTSGLSDDRVRPTLLSSLSLSEREALCGGMDASPYLMRSGGSAPGDVVTIGRLAGCSGVSRPRPGDRFLARGPAYLEFQMSDVAHPIPLGEGRRLSVPVAATGGRIEMWWAAEGSEWTRARSICWRPDPEGPNAPWFLALDRLPHWSPSQAARIRIIIRSTVAVVEGPRLLR